MGALGAGKYGPYPGDHHPVEVLGMRFRNALAVGETAILLHPPLPLAGVSIGTERGVSAE